MQILVVICEDDVTEEEAENILSYIEQTNPSLVKRVERYEGKSWKLDARPN